jgi:hypothetical protein
VTFHNPYDDTIAQGQKVIPRGSVRWLKTRLKVSGSVVSPDGDWDQKADIVSIRDPDGNPVTLNDWVTTEPIEGFNDPFDSDHPDHVGAPWIGLFHDGGGRFAQKIKPPQDAEITLNDPTRSYTVKWRIYRSGDPITATESFNVAESAELSFDPTIITPANVRGRVETQLGDSDLSLLIGDATAWARGYCDDWQALFDPSHPTLREAIILYAVAQVGLYDISAHRRPVSITEGDVSLRFHGVGGHAPALDHSEAKATQLIERYLMTRSPLRRPKFNRNRARGRKNDPWTGVL